MEIVNKETQRYSCCKEKTHLIHSTLFQAHIPLNITLNNITQREILGFILWVSTRPIIDQEPVRIANGMTESDLKEAILLAEKKMIYRAVRAFLEGRITLNEDKVIYEENSHV